MISDMIMMAAANTTGLHGLQGQLSLSSPVGSDQYGFSVSISSDGNTCAVGCPGRRVSSVNVAGAVYIYIRSAGVWTLQAELAASDLVSGANVGYAVAISSDGNTCAVGAPSNDLPAGAGAGAIYIFTRSGSTWTQQAKITASDAATGDRLGRAVALSADGNTCAGGAPFDDNARGTDAGSVYIFTRSGSTWTQQARLQASDGAASDRFGWSVSLSSNGSTCAIGAYQNSHGGFSLNGAAYVFTRSGSTWSQQAKLTASDTAASFEGFGTSVDVSSDGNTCVVGSVSKSTTAGTSSGCAYVFTRSGSVWSQQAILLPQDDSLSNAQFGRSVAISDDGASIVVGASAKLIGNFVNNGSCYFFRLVSASWRQVGIISRPRFESSQDFGFSVDVSSDARTVLVGAWRFDAVNVSTGNPVSNSGAAFAFIW